jgi:hypothetical protein
VKYPADDSTRWPRDNQQTIATDTVPTFDQDDTTIYTPTSSQETSPTFDKGNTINYIQSNRTSSNENRPLNAQTISPDHSKSKNNMTSRHCSFRNTLATAEHPLKVCGACKKVAYCDAACQKNHWPIHKPACRAAVKKDQDSYEDSNETEAKRDRDNIVARTDFINKDGNRVLGGTIYPAGTYFEWFEMPTPESPDGSHNTIQFTKPIAVWVSGLSDDKSELFEAQIVEGCKAGLDPLEIFHQVALEKGMTPADEQRANYPDAYEKALPILAARYNASRAKEVDINKRHGSKFMRRNEGGDVVLLDANNEEFVVSADAVHVLKFSGNEERTEVVFFDSDDITDMKHLCDDEKKTYRSMLARVVMEQRYPGKTVVPESEMKATAEAEMDVEQKAPEGDMDIN